MGVPCKNFYGDKNGKNVYMFFTDLIFSKSEKIGGFYVSYQC
jgi:hypothetical protein